MNRLIPLLLPVLLFAAGCGPAEDALEAVGLSENVDVQAPPEPTTVDDVLARLETDDFSGIVLIDQNGGLRIEPIGSADGPDGPPIDENTVFDIGSITKQFTGAAIVRLEMDGQLTVDDRLGDHLDDVGGSLAEVTLHELLTHTAGLPEAVGDDGETIDRSTFLARAMDGVVEPGEFRYSNVGYSVLGMVIETVSGGTYEEYLREVFFEPAGMTATGYVLPDFTDRTLAAGYIDDARIGLPNEQNWADDGPWWHLRANGGILSTAADMRRWNDALDGDSVLSASAKAKLFDRHVEEGEGAGTYYGYGWVSFPDGDGAWFHGHNGGNGVFFADVLRLPDDDVMIFLASNTAGADEDAAFRIAEALVDGGVGADCLPPHDLTSFEAADSFPATEAGETAAATIDIMLGGDDDERRTFADRHVSEQLAQGLSLDEQVAELVLLQEEFVGYTVEMIHVEDVQRLHVVLADQGDAPLVVSVFVDDADPTRVSCLQIDGG